MEIFKMAIKAKVYEKIVFVSICVMYYTNVILKQYITIYVMSNCLNLIVYVVFFIKLFTTYNIANSTYF